MAIRSRNILSLCAGVGGLELGILLALHSRSEVGRGVCYVEREAAAAASLVASMEGGWLHPAPIWSDMLTFDARPWRGKVHILASGDPCQDNSVAGKRAGASGDRFLAPEVCRLAEECRPDIIFRENVPGNADGQLEAIAPALERLGYRVAAGIFSSAETGNTMRRERLFIMAERVGCIDEGWKPVAGKAEGRRSRGQSGGRSGEPGSATGSRPLPSAYTGADRGDESAGLRDAEPQRRGGDMARPTSERSREARADFGRSAEWDCGTGGALEITINPRLSRARLNLQQGCVSGELGELRPEHVGHASSEGPQGQQRGQHVPAGRQVKSGLARLPSRTVLPPAVIPRPTDSRWIDLLDRFPEYQPALSKEEAESHLRRGVDAMAHRVERLRATGNGVDPMVAAYAFLSLAALHDEARSAA